MPKTSFKSWVRKHNESVGVHWSTPPYVCEPKKKPKPPKQLKLNWLSVVGDGIPVLKKIK